jgi:retinol dehydrogenase-12
MKIPSLEGKVALVTGANTGIGKVTALELVRAGAHTILACRNQQKAQEAIDEIIAETGADASRVEFLQLDLSSFEKVRESAAAFMAMELPLDILINNAGLAGIKALSKDGFEIAFGVNHLGHFLFTHLIFERLLEAERARIVNVASRAHYRVDGIDFGKLHTIAETTTGMTSYAYSKLANVLFTSELAERLEGTNITTYSLHPGVVASDIWRKVPGPLRWIGKLFMISNEEGAQTTLYCATSPDCADESGLYYDSCKVKKPSAAAHDKELARKLWEKSVEWTGAPELPL